MSGARTTAYAFSDFGGPIEAVERERPEPQGAEALVAVSHCGVCHTDVHVHQGYYDIGGGDRMLYRDRGVVPPVVMGHEVLGIVEAVGPDADPSLVGARRLVYPWIGCGACPGCAQGQEQLCTAPRYLGIFAPGGYARHVLVPDARYLLDVGGIEPGLAATLACSGLTAFGAIRKAGVLRDDEAVAVMGCGGVGQAALELLRMQGVPRVVALDPSPQKRALVEAKGHATALDPSAPDIGEALARVTGGRLMAVLDFVGSEATAALALGSLAKGGRYVVVGLYGGRLSYPLPFVPVRVLSILGSYVGSLDDLRELLALLRREGAPDLPVETRPMELAGQAVADLEAGHVAGRLVLTP